MDRAWLALKVTCNRDKENGHTKSEVNRIIRVSTLSKSDHEACIMSGTYLHCIKYANDLGLMAESKRAKEAWRKGLGDGGLE